MEWLDWFKNAIKWEEYKKLLDEALSNNIALNEKYVALKAQCSEQITLLLEAREIIKNLRNISIKESEQEIYWNNKWAKNSITYKADGEYEYDIRNLIFNKSHILSKYKGLNNLSHDDKALTTLKFVASRIKYQSDKEHFGKPELWKNPEYTYQERLGDCEDGALLLISLLRINGVPAYKVKLCAGYVKSGNSKAGHAYVIYLADNNEWYVLDWCYWYKESINAFKKIPHKDMTNYLDIWWTANDVYTWAQKSTRLGE